MSALLSMRWKPPVAFAGRAGVSNKFQEKKRRRRMKIRQARRQVLEEVGSRGGHSIPLALLTLICLVCFLCDNSKGKRNYAIISID